MYESVMFLHLLASNARIFLAYLLVCFLGAQIRAHAAEPQNSNQQPSQLPCDVCQGITGDWGGKRSALLESGVEISLANTGDVLFIRQDGNEDVTYTNLSEAAFAFDMEQLADISGGSAYVWVVGTHGDDPADVIGSIHAPSNIAAEDAFRLLEAWYEQSAYDDRLGILVGFYDVDTEFDLKGTVDLFVSGGHGTGLDLSETGLNGPSIFPVTSFGARLRVDLTDKATARLAVLDGVPGDPGDPTATAVLDFSSDQGVFAITELDYMVRTGATFWRFALGAWKYTTRFDDLLETEPDGTPVQRNGSNGIYGFAEWLIFREAGTTDQGLAALVRVGSADEDVNRIGGYYGAGLVYRGLFHGRDDDTLGIGFSTALNGNKFKQAQAEAGNPVTDSETELIVAYSALVTPWLRLQPVVQYYLDPGTDPAAGNALIAGVRVAVLF
jgi:porin